MTVQTFSITENTSLARAGKSSETSPSQNHMLNVLNRIHRIAKEINYIETVDKYL